MAAGVTEVIVEKDQDDTPAAAVTVETDTKKPDKKETKALAHQNGTKKSK